MIVQRRSIIALLGLAAALLATALSADDFVVGASRIQVWPAGARDHLVSIPFIKAATHRAKVAEVVDQTIALSPPPETVPSSSYLLIESGPRIGAWYPIVRLEEGLIVLPAGADLSGVSADDQCTIRPVWRIDDFLALASDTPAAAIDLHATQVQRQDKNVRLWLSNGDVVPPGWTKGYSPASTTDLSIYPGETFVAIRPAAAGAVYAPAFGSVPAFPLEKVISPGYNFVGQEFHRARAPSEVGAPRLRSLRLPASGALAGPTVELADTLTGWNEFLTPFWLSDQPVVDWRIVDFTAPESTLRLGSGLLIYHRGNGFVWREIE